MQKIWQAKWIADARFAEVSPRNIFHTQHQPLDLSEHRPDLKNCHTLFRKCFHLPDRLEQAFLDITADDYYKLYLNDRFVGQGPAPAYHVRYFYNRYDVAAFLRSGQNVLAVHVYYQGLINRVWNSGDYRQGMIAELSVNGEFWLGADSSWKHQSAREYVGTTTTGYETQYLEDIDNRLKAVGWRTAGYDDHAWPCACEQANDDHQLVLQPTPPVVVYAVRPQVIKEVEPGRYVIDFGQEITGQFTMQARGAAGQMIEIRCGEELEAGTTDRVRYQMRCNCTYQERWTLSGGLDILEQYDYKAFRYVEVLAPPAVVNPDSFAAIVRHYPFDDQACTFESSQPLLNDIWRICRDGVKFGTQEAYLDCPSREKGQYLGDAVIIAQSHAYLTGDLRLGHKALRDFALSTSICPGMMAVAPGSFMQEIADYSLLWPYFLWKYYWQSGDREFLQEMYPVAEGILTYFSRYKRDDGLLENVRDKWNLIDWPENLRDGYDFNLSQQGVGDGCHNVINAYYCGAVATLNRIRDELQIIYQDELPQLKQAFSKAFYRPAFGLCADSTVSTHAALHANVLPLLFDLVPAKAISPIVSLIRQKRLNCGVYFAYFVLKALASVGEYDLVYELITSDDEHSWGNMLREGATTCFEAWGKDRKWNTSLCHPWASAPTSILIEDIIGLSPAKPGWTEVVLTPHIPKTLRDIRLSIPTPRGQLTVSIDDGRTTLQVPSGMHVRTCRRPDRCSETCQV